MSLDQLKPYLPSIDRPFGIELWPLFVKAYSSIAGHSPTDFKFVPGKTPMSTLTETASVLVAYYVIIFGGRELMQNRPAYKLNGFFMSHNLGLTMISFILLVLFIEQLAPTVWNHGVFFAICSHKGGWTKELVTLYFLNYITKYLELVDTVFLVLKKKPLSTVWTPRDLSDLGLKLNSLPPYLSSRRNRSAMLYPTGWVDLGLLGSHHLELDGPCGHVLVLLPKRTRRSHLVEGVDHPSPDPAVRY